MNHKVHTPCPRVKEPLERSWPMITEPPRCSRNHGIDFCCGGKVALRAACSERGIDLETITRELHAVKSEPAERGRNYASWEPPFLADYIINAHHTYVKENSGQLAVYAHKIAEVHGAHHPEVIKIASIYDRRRDGFDGPFAGRGGGFLSGAQTSPCSEKGRLGTGREGPRNNPGFNRETQG